MQVCVKQLSLSKSFDPLWERYLVPAVVSSRLTVHGHWTEDYYTWTKTNNWKPEELVSQLFVPDDQVDYQLKLKGQMLKDIPYGVVVRRGNRSDLKISSSDPDLFNWLAVGVPPYIAPGIMDWLSRFR